MCRKYAWQFMTTNQPFCIYSNDFYDELMTRPGFTDKA